MKAIKTIRSEIEILDSLNKIVGIHDNKNRRERNPRTIFLQKVSPNNISNPVKIQLLKTINDNNITHNHYFKNFNKKKANLNENDKKITENIKIDNNPNVKIVSEPLYSSPRIIKKKILYNSVKQTQKNFQNLNINIDRLEPKYNKEHRIRDFFSKSILFNKKSSSTLGSPDNKGILQKNISYINSNVKNSESVGKKCAGRESQGKNSLNNNLNSPQNSIKDKVQNKHNKNISQNNHTTNCNIDIKLEDVILFEQKLNNIIKAIDNYIANINDKKNIDNILFSSSSIFSFYFKSSLCNKMYLIFQEQNKLIIKSSINLKLFMLMLIFHLALNPFILIKVIDNIKIIFEFLIQNFYLFVKKYYIYYGEMFILQNEQYLEDINYTIAEYGFNNLNEVQIKDIINRNCCNIAKIVSNILNIYHNFGNSFFLSFSGLFNNLSRITENEINYYFFTYLYESKKKFES